MEKAIFIATLFVIFFVMAVAYFNTEPSLGEVEAYGATAYSFDNPNLWGD